MAKKIFYKPTDAAVAYTEVEIAELEKKLIEVYSEAEADIQKKMDDFTAKYQKQDLIYQKQLKEGLITQADYDDWKKGKVFVGKQWAAKKDEITAVLHNSNKISTSMINMSAFDVFGENSNYMAYTMEHTAGVNFGFQVYNTDAVAQLIKDDPDLLPKWKVDQKKDYDWNRKNLNNSITQGIIQGESLSKISKRVSTSLAGKNENLMKTFAKTGMTQAQNSGRLERMEKGKALGIDVKKKWVATLDSRTRYSHRELDGQIVDTDEDFKTEGYTIAYPGDPQAHPSLVYNCRCAITSSFDKYPSKYQRYDNIDGVPVKGMSYNDWKKAKENGENIRPVPFKPVVAKAEDKMATAVAQAVKEPKAKPKTTPTPKSAEPAFDDFKDIRSANKIRAKMDELGVRSEFDAIVEKYGGDSFAPAATVWGNYLNDTDPRITKEFTALFKKFTKPTVKAAAEKVETVKVAKEATKKVEKVIKGSTLDHYQEAVDRVIKEKEATMTAAQIKTEKAIAKKIDKMMTEVVEESDFRMRVPGDNGNVLKKIFESGRFKTQLETGETGGEGAIFAPGIRRNLSEKLFGAPEGLANSKFEKYGYLGSKDIATDIANDWFDDAYGSAIVTFKKKNLKNRTTMTFGDSMLNDDFGGVFAPSKVNAIDSYTSYSPVMAGDLPDFYEQFKKTFDDKPDPQHMAGDLKIGYFELQFHDDLTLDDVESITVKEELIKSFFEKDADIKKLIKDKGIKIQYQSGGKIKEWEL